MSTCYCLMKIHVIVHEICLHMKYVYMLCLNNVKFSPCIFVPKVGLFNCAPFSHNVAFSSSKGVS